METKQELLARLSATRARLLWELLGIKEEVLTWDPVTGEWTAKGLLSHMADYDQFYGTLVASALSGMIINETIDVSKINENSLKGRSQVLTIDETIEVLEEARSEFRAAIERVSQKDLDRLFYFNSKAGNSQGTISNWVRSCLNHEARHVRDIQQWCSSSALRRKAGPKGILLAVMQAAREDLLDSIALVPEREWTTNHVTGKWTLKDVIGHITGWDQYFINWLHSMTGKPTRELYHVDDELVFNDYLYKGRIDQTLADTWKDFHANHQKLFDELRTLSQEDLERPGTSKLIDFEDIYHLAWSALEHDMHHAALLRAGIRVIMPKSLVQFEGLFT